ncbi:NAD(P)H-hydrate dehydratase [Caulobacter sp. NIBR2454]|uniref:NAD(P)H-hydrate dehydratase n=1 Tax=Caulobacter sp. NIBR2454 TaxID=3015996 RepID=UPI0022B60A5F|nr:NAD(P)H-hydrate dehydratase [Caulobacter sp. NIBR2454]
MTDEITADLLRQWPLPQPGDGGKEERGQVLVVGGHAEIPGAVVLAATAALRAGAGKLQVATVEQIAAHLSLSVPEARAFALKASNDGAITAKSVKALVQHVARCKAVLVGPGTMDEGEAIALELLAAESDAAFVLDAGALPAAESGREFLAALDGRVVLTPHAGEMSQLTGRPKEEIEADPLGAAQRAAKRYGAVAVMKGAATHIAAPDGQTWRYPGGGVGLGASGSGDVLGGLIAGLLARGAGPAQAAAFGVYLHGEAGKVLARKIGPLGFLAREISAEVPGLMGELA